MQLRRSNTSISQNLIELDLCRMKELFCRLGLGDCKKLLRLMDFRTFLSLPILAELIQALIVKVAHSADLTLPLLKLGRVGVRPEPGGFWKHCWTLGAFIQPGKGNLCSVRGRKLGNFWVKY